MERCLDCNSLLTKEETVCIECGTKVGNDEAGMADFIAMFCTILFYASVLVLIGSPFTDKLPSFMVCMLTTCALLFVMRTAKESKQKIKKR